MIKNFFKSTLNIILRYSKYALFFWIALAGFPRIYIELLGTYTNDSYTFSYFFVLAVFFIYYTDHNSVLNKMYWGPALSGFLIFEAFFFLLFAQYHFIAAVIILASVIPIGIFLFKLFLTEKPNKIWSEKFIAFCRKKAAAALCCVMAVVLLIPSGIGLYKEYIDVSDAETWAQLIALYKASYSSTEKKPASLFEANRSTLIKINDWDNLKKEERVELIQRIGLIEEEYLGIKNYSEVIITTEKLNENEYGSYIDGIKTIRININHICNDSAEENISTVLHEVFHVYEHYVVSTLDFNSEEVKTNYYYETARSWYNNINNYHSADKNYSAYYDQALEADARAHAEKRTADYLVFAQSCEGVG